MDLVNIKHPFLTVDAVILCDNDSIILIKRKNSPYKGFWALPGGFVEYGETVESAVLREVTEETGLSVDLNEISGVYSDPNRDPRGHVITICFTAAKTGGNLKADTDAMEVHCLKLDDIFKLNLAFDHKKIIIDALNHLDLI
jgi:8-oxo-dGTP diphosphatase